MNQDLKQWVEECARYTEPDAIVWCDGSDAEIARIYEEGVAEGTFVKMNTESHPGCYYHRSDPGDVARVEHLTFICSEDEEDAGPTNKWMAPADAEAKVWPLFKGAMKGRTMFVVPYIMGPVGSPISKVGIEITDSRYVVANMRIMTRMGLAALDQLGDSKDFVKGLHSLGDLSPDRRFIMHFPQSRSIWSIGSGYGGNALLGKKCHALRIASAVARDEEWMAEHMLIVGIENPEGETRYVAAAFPSACGKTNLAMLVPPATMPGWKVWTVGDDIAWMKYGPDGKLYAINPENGFFGVAPGTSPKTNPNAFKTVQENSIFTNVGLSDDGQPWWEGMGTDAPERMTTWKGLPYDPAGDEKAAHPNSRFTGPASQCPCISPNWEGAEGVPISAILFGGRRATTNPLVFEARSWNHGVFVGASVGSETTAAATGAVGVVRRDPMAMLPFCGYHMGDYFQHWVDMGAASDQAPKIFHVNWFRQNAEGEYLWPGFGDNLRVLQWVFDRCDGKVPAKETPIGFVPEADAINVNGLNLPDGLMEEVLAVKPEEWKIELENQSVFFNGFGEKLPKALRSELEDTQKRFGF